MIIKVDIADFISYINENLDRATDHLVVMKSLRGEIEFNRGVFITTNQLIVLEFYWSK